MIAAAAPGVGRAGPVKVPATTVAAVVIRREQRDALRTAGLLELSSSTEDLECALDGHNAAAMIDSRARLEAAARLLDDLGWAEDDVRTGFGITMGADRLIPLLERIDGNTRHALVDYSRMLRSRPTEEESPTERDDRLNALREYWDLDLDMQRAALMLRTALERDAESCRG